MTNLTKFYPGLNRVLVSKKDLPANDTCLVLTSASKYSYGTIEAVGSIKDAKDIDSTMFNVGDNVYFLPQSGISIDLDGKTYQLLTITELLVGEKANG